MARVVSLEEINSSVSISAFIVEVDIVIYIGQNSTNYGMWCESQVNIG